MKDDKKNPQSHFLTSLLWPVIVLLCPITFYLKLNDYGLFHGEILIIAGSIILLGLLLGWLYSRGWWVLQILIFSAVLTVTLSFLPEFKSNGILVACFLATVLLGVFFIKHVADLMAIMAGCFFLGIVFLPVGEHLNEPLLENNPSQKAVNPALKPIIHIILDEHEGIGGIPTNIAGGDVLKNTLVDFYRDNGFTLHTEAYSHFPLTYNSIPNLLNFSARPEDRYYFFKNKSEVGILDENAYFKALTDKGYTFRVYQADFINYCKVPGVNYASCYTYPSHSLKLLQNLDLTLSQRTSYFLKSYLLQSILYVNFITAYDESNKKLALMGFDNDKLQPWDQDQMSAIAIPATFQQLKKDVLSHPEGMVFFAHMLLPHSPYMYNADCSPILDPNRWDVNYNLVLPTNTPDSRERRYRAYFQQALCAEKQVADLFDAMKKAGIYDDATIVVNGDHGSRIVITSPVSVQEKNLTLQDYSDSYKTLFAVKFPHAQGKIDASQESIEVLLANFTESVTSKPVSYTPVPQPFIFLIDQEKKMGDIMKQVNGPPFALPSQE